MTNTGGTYSGREVVQVYVTCPAGKLAKEYRRLVTFGKTDVLTPSEKQTLVMEIPFSMLGSYDETAPGWILERGDYVIWAGNSLQSAIPVGTVLAQTWDTALVKQVGEMIGREREEFGVTLWLAPGMNIHRNPLCGRNFDYYSEDPLLAGTMAAAMTKGVQTVPGCGTTIKHFACNNQEDNRLGSDSILSERALREIYLKGFEVAVKTAQPMSIMTSYNLINGIHAANHPALCTKVARCEWGFEGVIMTDWTTTENGPDCTASGCMRAGNDLVMPGAICDRENLEAEYEPDNLSIDDVKACVGRLVNIIWQSNRY